MKNVRRSVDAAMTLLLITLMGYNLTGNAFHEWGGAALFLLFLTHLWLNRQWWTRLFKGKYRPVRLCSTFLNLLLLLTIGAVIIAALPISGSLFPNFPFWREEMWPVQWHVATANWFLVLSALHAGAYWGRIRPRWNIMAKPTVKRLWQAMSLCIVAYGLWAIHTRNLVEKLAFYYTFDFSRAEETFSAFLCDYVSMFLALVIVSYHGFSFLQRHWK